MSLQPGTRRLGSYEVTVLIGSGGWGRSGRLNRDVALKILPDAFAADPDPLARFKREAQVLASLNHPDIAAIYGIEQSEDPRALVLELVEDPTLADRIASGPIPMPRHVEMVQEMLQTPTAWSASRAPMFLSFGTRLGVDHVTAKIGEGGVRTDSCTQWL